MRSSTVSQAAEMRWSFWLSLSLSYLPIAGGIGTCSLSQQLNEEIWRDRGQSVSLPCELNGDCTEGNIKYQWFAFKENSHQLNLQTHKYSMERGSLQITSLNVNDSGIYYCAVVLKLPSKTPASGIQMIGPGTTLVVRGESMPVVWHILLWFLFVLLAIYSLAVMVLIIRKKTGQHTGISMKPHKNNSTKRMHFRAVVQELYSRRNSERHKQKTGSRDPSHNKVQSPQSYPSTDDIYQNL